MCTEWGRFSRRFRYLPSIFSSYRNVINPGCKQVLDDEAPIGENSARFVDRMQRKLWSKPRRERGRGERKRKHGRVLFLQEYSEVGSSYPKILLLSLVRLSSSSLGRASRREKGRWRSRYRACPNLTAWHSDRSGWCFPDQRASLLSVQGRISARRGGRRYLGHHSERKQSRLVASSSPVATVQERLLSFVGFRILHRFQTKILI